MDSTQMTPEYVDFLREKQTRDREIELNRVKIQARGGEKDEDGFSRGPHFFRDDRIVTKSGEVHEGKIKIEGDVAIVKRPGLFKDKVTVVHLDDVKDVK